MVKAKQAAIRKIFMADQLEPQDSPGQTTAYEVHVRIMLIRQLLGPVYGRLQSEYLQRMIDRTFGLGFRSRLFTPAPQSLAGRNIHVKYISPLARAQRAEEVTAMDQFELSLAQNAQIDQTVVDNYNMDLATRERASLLGVPMKLILSEDDVQQKRENRQAAREEMAKQEVAAQGAQEFAKTAGQRVAAGV
jgi:hypothetical protein